MEELSRRGFCAAAGAGLVVINLPGCGGPNGLPMFAGDAGSAVDAAMPVPDLGSAPADMAMQPADMAQMPKGDMAKPNPCVSMTMVNAGPAKSIALDTATFYMCSPSTRIFVCRDNGGVFALTAICTHTGCNTTFNMGGPEFDCPCHGSRFDFNGAVLMGPAGSPLVHYLCTLDGKGNVIVDHTKTVAASVRI